jgi:NADH dehydrogenase FAD-containing subunit
MLKAVSDIVVAAMSVMQSCGVTVAASHVLLLQKNKDVSYFEAECFKIDATKKAVHCRSAVGTNLDGNGDFEVDYDYLVVALGATVNTFNTPGVMEHCHFLKVKSLTALRVPLLAYCVDFCT